MPFTRESLLAVGQRSFGLLLPILFGAASSGAAEFHPTPRELWSGHYQCGPIFGKGDQFAAYTAAVTLTLENRHASITKESARIRETLTGKVAASGHVVLDGIGEYKANAGPNWRYRFEGTFKGMTFQATGAMVGPKGTKLRDCSMTLTRLSRPHHEATAATGSSVGNAQPTDRDRESSQAVREPPDISAHHPQQASHGIQPLPRLGLSSQPAPPVSDAPAQRSSKPVESTAASPQIAQQLEDSGSSGRTQLNTAADAERRPDPKAGPEIPQAPAQAGKLNKTFMLLAFGVVAAAFVTRERWTPRITARLTHSQSRPKSTTMPTARGHKASWFAAAMSNGRRLFAHFLDINWTKAGIYTVVYTVAAIGCWMIIAAMR